MTSIIMPLIIEEYHDLAASPECHSNWFPSTQTRPPKSRLFPNSQTKRPNSSINQNLETPFVPTSRIGRILNLGAERTDKLRFRPRPRRWACT